MSFVSIVDSQIGDNSAGGEGGGLVASKATIIVMGSSVNRNTAKEGAGCFLQDESDLQLSLLLPDKVNSHSR